ncbi:MAG TPA: pyrroline-5-carboxylate reductase [Nevskiaceae bacterium]|nr:pyrroline-5-carboxylate reductase [Nevskiaceae bacterium]
MTTPAPAVDPSHLEKHIAFIGGGNMGAALATGLLARGWQADHLRILEPLAARREWLTQHLQVRATDTPSVALDRADAIVLAVKPQYLKEAVAPLQIKPGTLVLSIAAGIRLASLRQWLGDGPRLVRCMPNTPALVGAGAAALCAAPDTPAEQRALAQALISAVGVCCWVEDEARIDAVTALSGSGPAYFFLLAEAMEAAGVALGLSADAAALLARQTLIGAGQLVAAESTPLAELRARVTSKGGTTAAALEDFARHDFRGAVADAMTAARNRSRELGAPTTGH